MKTLKYTLAYTFGMPIFYGLCAVLLAIVIIIGGADLVFGVAKAVQKWLNK